MRRRVAQAAALMLAIFGLGVSGYKAIGGDAASWVDALYMTANVLTTAGFREAVDIQGHTGGLLFTVFLLIVGAVALVYFTSAVTAFVVEGDLTQGFRRRRMERTIQALAQHHIVCGASPTGIAVLEELISTSRPAVLIDMDQAAAERTAQDHPGVPVVIGDFTDDETLVRAGIGRALGIVVATDDDKDALVTTVTARQLNPRIRIVARAVDERAAQRLRNAGADAVVSTNRIGGMRMASELLRPSVVTFLDQMLRDKDRNLRIEELEIPRHSPFAARRLADLDVRGIADLLVLAVREPDGGPYIYNPPPDHVVQEGSTLIVMGDPRGMRTLRRASEGVSMGEIAAAEADGA